MPAIRTTWQCDPLRWRKPGSVTAPDFDFKSPLFCAYLAAATTAAAFLVLLLGSFRGLHQLGLVSAVGMAVVALLLLLAGPALLCLGAPRHPAAQGLLPQLGRLAGRSHWPATITLVLLVGAAAAWLAAAPAAFPIDGDPRTLRPTHDPLYDGQIALHRSLGLGARSEPVLVAGGSAQQVVAAMAVIESRAHALQPAPVATLRPVAGLVAGGSDGNAQRLAEAVDWPALFALEAAGLGGPYHHPFWSDLHRLHELVMDPTARDPASLAQGDLAPLVARVLRQGPDGRWYGRVDLGLAPQVDRTALVAGLGLDPGTGQGHAGLPAGTSAALSGQLALAWFLHDALAEELPTLALGGALVTALLLMLGLRSLRHAAAGLAVLVAGMAVTCAAVPWLVGPWNLLSVAVLPLVAGIGIDDAVHSLAALRQRPPGPNRARHILRDIGPPMAMTSATTALGFAAMLLSDYRGLQLMGGAAAIGILACFVTTVLAIPLLDRLVGGRGQT